ncbi:MAG TPA: SDR family oxidoreductase [Candidatus Eisenbacteria bacterium]|nr:SDR family oxidoreductase [Candidatus Eisenbacteria bacterium]
MANVLVTGCSSGFGLLTALRFARAGDRVLATMRTPAKAPRELAAAVEERLSIRVARLDVCDQASVDAAVREAGDVDVLVNNAGIELRSSIEDATPDDVHKQFDTNVFGTLRVIRAVLPRMRSRRTGTIVNVSSIAGLVARPYGGYYSASKHALEAISEALHFEVHPFGVRVVLIEPGQYGTRLLDNAFPGAGFTSKSPYWAYSERFDERLVRLRPGGEMADPAEVANLIYDAVHDPAPKLRYLAGEDAHMIATAYKQMDFEQYEQMMRQSLDWRD